jgi:L-lactate dehydrogenase complex protein LldE
MLANAQPDVRERVSAFSAKVHELCAFLADVRGLLRMPGTYSGVVTYHDSCSGLRELGIKTAPRRLLATMQGVRVQELEDCESCCGFGGLFATKYPDISNAIVTRKADAAAASEADVLLAGDLGCLMNIAGKLARRGHGPACRHVAEVLAGELSDPPIAAAGT